MHVTCHAPFPKSERRHARGSVLPWDTRSNDPLSPSRTHAMEVNGFVTLGLCAFTARTLDLKAWQRD